MKYDLNQVKESCINRIKRVYGRYSDASVTSATKAFEENYPTYVSIINDIESNKLWQLILKVTPKTEILETLGNEYHTHYISLRDSIHRLEEWSDKMMDDGCVPGSVTEWYDNRYYNYCYYA